MSKKKKRRKVASRPAPHRPWWLWVTASAALLAVLAGLSMLLISNGSAPEDGTPDVVVDQPLIDEGYQPLDTAIRTSFTLRNEGDAPLRILGEPQVELVEGC